ncbi:hypothetical protein [Alistipes sp.]|uniref:hypothetical protein n=1 Tax=Alistipes sp. TaxID=1872444 RepID=UPI003AF10BFC
MTVDEANILLAELSRDHNGPYSNSERATIEKLYTEVLGKPLRSCRCPDKWRDAVAEIHSYIKKHGKMKEKSNYKLRAGVILQIAGSSEIYTNDNLTDEVAAAFLKEHPNAAGRFEVIPSAKKEAAASKAGGKTSELEAALKRIAALESEKAELESRCAALQAQIDAATAADAAEEAQVDRAASENPEAAADDAIRQAIAAELLAGKSKSAIKSALAGKEIGGVKLTHRLISDCIDRIAAEA